MKHFLVTGGFGFIGSHLVERLLADGHHVFVVDDLSSSLMTEQDVQAWAVKFDGRLTYRLEPIEHYSRRGKLGVHFDGIFHLASPVGAAGVLQWRGVMAQRIVEDSVVVTDLADSFQCRLVYVSTSEVYGGGVNGLCTEDTPCIVPINAHTVRLEYAIGKLAGEIAVLNTPELDSIIIRPFNVAGARQNAELGFVLPRFIQQALAGEPLTVFGDGSQIRAFTHVADIVDGLLLAMERGKRGNIYNLGNPANRTTILELARTVWKVSYGDEWIAKSQIEFTDGKAVFGEAYTEAPNKIPDATKAMTELGWQPTRDVETTIRDTAMGIRKVAV